MPAIPAPVDDADLRARVATLTVEQKVRLLSGRDWWELYGEPSIGLRPMIVSDGPAGVRGVLWDERVTSANVPSPTALAATWDEQRVERVGRLLADQCRRLGVDVLLAPTVNLHRTPYGGRHFECFSEDPLLTSRIGVAYVRGLQSEGVGATVKHFIANDQETERFTYDVRADERTLRELYAPPFDAIVREARVWAVMAAYNQVDGSTMTESPLLRRLLQDEWGFDGVTMSDWYAARSVEAAGQAGLDLAMPGPETPWAAGLAEAVRDGRVDEAALDDKVLRLLRLAARVGALDGVDGVATATPWDDGDVSRELRATAVAGFVLARNSGTLPLDADALSTVAVIGPNAAVARTLGGGSATVFPPYTVSPLDGLRAALDGRADVRHAVGVRTYRGLPQADPAFLRTPAGDEGIEVRFLDADGAELHRETRRTGKLFWVGDFGSGIDTAAVRTIEVHARFTAQRDGRHTFGVSGLSSFRFRIGDTVVDEPGRPIAGVQDFVEQAQSPPLYRIDTDLTAGETVDVEVRHAVWDPTALTFFTLHLDVPVPTDDEELERAVALAAESDVAVVVVGTTDEVESEGFDRPTLALPGRQDELVRRVAAANPRTVVVVNAGAPVLLPWADEVPAVLLVWFPGQEMGHALADVLLGVAEPGGRLPTTWPADEHDELPSPTPVDGVIRYDEGLHIGHRLFERTGLTPRFWLGHGLGYTTWEYDGAAAPQQVAAGADVAVRVRVRNTGTRRGREVVQVYASRPGSAVERPAHWLAGFAVVEAEPGEEVELSVPVAARAFEHWDVASHGWTLEPGVFSLEVGRSVGDLRAAVDVTVG